MSCLISFVIFIILLPIILKIYLKLTCGICKCSKHLVGKVVIVTGGNAGIGFETARDLADRGARVILACRNEGRGTAARDKIIALTGNSDVHYQQLDLGSSSSVRGFAKHIIETEKQIDILINNAGIYFDNNEKTDDGLLLTMQTNHFGPFLLTNLLLPIVKSSAPSRIINVASIGYKFGDIDLENLNMEKTVLPDTKYGLNTKYVNSKLCNILMTIELERQLKGTGVTANCLCPGMVETEIMKVSGSFVIKYIKPLRQLFAKNWWEGAQTTIYLAVSPEVKDVSGGFFTDCRRTTTTKLAQDTEVARKLWEVSEKIVKLK